LHITELTAKQQEIAFAGQMPFPNAIIGNITAEVGQGDLVFGVRSGVLVGLHTQD